MSTYTPIASANTPSGVSSITFANLPQNYQALRIIVDGRGISGAGYSQISYRYNNDTSANYSWVAMIGVGSGTGFSNKGSNQTAFYCGFMTDPSTTIGLQITEINNYATPNAHKIAISRWGYANSAANLTQIAAGQYRSINPITSITVFNAEGTAFSTGTTIDIYGIASGGPKAFGGDTVTTDGTYYYHTFRSSGTFTPTQALSNVDYLVVAGGGGGGGTQEYGGGGGAGGYRTSIGGSALSLTAQAYTVTVGAGGASNNKGSNSVFSSITSTGGGLGGNSTNAGTGGTSFRGGTGGSGGGSGNANLSGGTGNEGGFSPVEGYAGGSVPSWPGNGAASGGGGAGGVGGNGGSNTAAGAGGVGVSNSISGTAVFYAGGGGGGNESTSYAGGAGGNGGGGSGRGSGGAGSSGTANTGGGGGGGTTGHSGGSGIVIIRYSAV
jgi:hypothetical protein